MLRPSIGRLPLGAATVFAALFVALTLPGKALAADCTSIGVSPSALEYWDPGDPTYEWRARGWAHVSNPASKAGCTIRVCLGEELGAGNWVGSNCVWWVIQAGYYDYSSDAPFIDCENYGGTGWFRSYAAMGESGGVILLGPPVKLC